MAGKVQVGVGIGPPSDETRPNGLDVSADGAVSVVLVDANGAPLVGPDTLPRLVLGGFTFALNPRDSLQVTEPPLLALHSPPGGGPRYQWMGRGETRITLRGKLIGDSAWSDLAALRALNGTRQPLSYGALWSAACWARLDWTFNRDDDIDYALNLVIESLAVLPGGPPSSADSFTFGGGVRTQPAQAEGQAQTANPSTQAAATVSYTVRTGDTLWGIAQAQYGEGNLWPVIARLNDIDDPSTITPGQVLQLPSDRAAARATKAQQDAQRAALPNDNGTGLAQTLRGAP